MKKWIKRFSLLLTVIMLATAVTPTTAVQAAKSPVTKIATQNITANEKLGKTFYLHLLGNYNYRTTVSLAPSSKKTKLKLKYSHKIRPSKSGTLKLTVGKKTVTICKPMSYPYKQQGVPDHLTTFLNINLYLEKVEIKTGTSKKWKKVKVTHDGVKAEGVYSEMKAFTLKKISKGTKIRITFNARIGTPRR